MVNEIKSALEQERLKSQVVSVDHLEDLREELEDHHKEGRLSDEIYGMLRGYFQFNVPDELPNAKSIIIAAADSPRTVFHAVWKGRRVPMQTPPTYADLDLMWRKTHTLLTRTVGKAGYTAVSARLPVKSLAVHSGLAKYGKNNITYIDGWGSLHGLAVFHSDIPCEQDSWFELRMMERCKSCNACANSCPTKAIHADWVVVRAERCLAHLNEGRNEFPDWVDPSWHDSIVGCFHCQQVCPENAAVLDRVTEGPEFSEEETSAILKAKSADDVSPEIYEKLKSIGLHTFVHAISRNLRVLLQQTGLSV